MRQGTILVILGVACLFGYGCAGPGYTLRGLSHGHASSDWAEALLDVRRIDHVFADRVERDFSRAARLLEGERFAPVGDLAAARRAECDHVIRDLLPLALARAENSGVRAWATRLRALPTLESASALRQAQRALEDAHRAAQDRPARATDVLRLRYLDEVVPSTFLIERSIENALRTMAYAAEMQPGSWGGPSQSPCHIEPDPVASGGPHWIALVALALGADPDEVAESVADTIRAMHGD